MTYNDFIDLFSAIVDSPAYSTSRTSPTALVSGHFVPDVKRIHYNGSKTIVWFADGSKADVECSAGDKYDRQTALAYAIIKRLYGKVGAYDKNGKWDPCLVDGNGFGCKMKKLVDAGFDQVQAEKDAIEKKRAAQAAHEARQKREQAAAFERKAKKLAEELRLKQRAEEILAASLKNPSKKIITEDKSHTEDKPRVTNDSPKDSWKAYRRPDKPFSQFTDAEKREYWRAHNAKRRITK